MTSTGPSSDDRRPAVEPLEGVTRDQWVDLAGRTLAAKRRVSPLGGQRAARRRGAR